MPCETARMSFHSVLLTERTSLVLAEINGLESEVAVNETL